MALSEIERKILAELIRNPRASDNAVSRLTGVPLKTVNRKRKELESKGIINYMVCVDNSSKGTGELLGNQIYIVKFKYGISRKMFFDNLRVLVSSDELVAKFKHLRKHMHQMCLCEHAGHLTIVMQIESRVDEDILEIYNTEVIPVFYSIFGSDCIESTQSLKMTHQLLYFNNYIMDYNLKDGRIRDDFPIKDIVVD